MNQKTDNAARLRAEVDRLRAEVAAARDEAEKAKADADRYKKGLEEVCARSYDGLSFKIAQRALHPAPAARADAARKEPPAKAHGCEVGE